MGCVCIVLVVVGKRGSGTTRSWGPPAPSPSDQISLQALPQPPFLVSSFGKRDPSRTLRVLSLRVLSPDSSLPPTSGGPHLPLQVQTPDQRGAGGGQGGRGQAGDWAARRVGGGRGGRDGCTAEPSGRAGQPTDAGWQVRPPRPVPVNDTAFTSTRLGARTSSVVASNESGYEWSGRERGGGRLSHPPLPLRENELGGERWRSYLVEPMGWTGEGEPNLGRGVQK